MSDNAFPPWLEAPLSRGLSMRGHALLVHAPGALGQFDLAVGLARAWLCESPLDGRACGQCGACRLMAGHSHPDFQLLLPDALRASLGWGSQDAEAGDDGEGKGKTKLSREIRIDALRKTIDWCQKTSSRGGAKVLVIHPAEEMNAATANALLKTLEEPPGRLRLVLTAADPEALLPTVRSRCQRLPIALPSTQEAQAWLAGQGVPDADVLLAAAGGQPQGALALHREGISGAAWAQVPDAARRGQAAAFNAWSVARLVDALHKLCHDLLSLHAGSAPRFFSAAMLAPAQRPGLPPLPALLAWQQDLLRAARHDEHPWHVALRADALLVQAAGLWQTPRASHTGQAGALATLPRR